MHEVEERHDTEFSSVCTDVAGFTALATLQMVPFHCSTSGSTSVSPGPLMPAATQNEGPAQDTPLSSLLPAPVGFGLGTTDHVDPFHCSISVFSLGLPLGPG
jgi:hypothetical protein